MKSAKNELLQFLAGLVMLVAGLFIFSQKVIVYSSFLGGFSLGGMSMTFGRPAYRRDRLDVCQRRILSLKGFDRTGCFSDHSGSHRFHQYSSDIYVAVRLDPFVSAYFWRCGFTCKGSSGRGLQG